MQPWCVVPLGRQKQLAVPRIQPFHTCPGPEVCQIASETEAFGTWNMAIKALERLFWVDSGVLGGRWNS